MAQITFNERKTQRNKLRAIAKQKVVSMADLIRQQIRIEWEKHIRENAA